MSALGIFGALTFLGTMTGLTITVYVIAKEMLELSLKEEEEECKHEYNMTFVPHDKEKENNNEYQTDGDYMLVCIHCGDKKKWENQMEEEREKNRYKWFEY